MIFLELELDGAYLLTTQPNIDARGEFTRLFCGNEFRRKELVNSWVQVNKSTTNRQGTVRGMHFQYHPHAEVKLISCLRGKVFDVIVDIRYGSPTFGKWHGEYLEGQDYKFLYVPEGFAHGFQTLSDDVEMIYFHSMPYNFDAQGGLSCHDPDVGIFWPETVVNLSTKDAQLPYLKNLRPFNS